MTKEFIDLHMHSLYSDDGEFTPSELVTMCHDAGVEIMAIADHNSTRGVKEAQKKAKDYQMKVIPAIEIDCTYKDINLHVLGYGIDYQAVIFQQLEENVYQQEKACSLEKLELTNQLGFALEQVQLDGLSKNGVYTGEMFGEVLLNDPRYFDHDLLKPYREGGNRSDNPYVNFYWDFYAQGKPCYTKVVYPTLKETIDIIHEHGGVAILAHPGNNLKGQFEVFDEMIPLGLDGVEAFSSYHGHDVNDYFYKQASLFDMMVTCGSDFHGKTKPAIQLGQMGCFIDEKIIEEKLKDKNLI